MGEAQFDSEFDSENVRPLGEDSGKAFQPSLSTREIMEELVVAELRARRMTRRGQSQLIRLARDYRLSETEARSIIEAACDRLAEEGVVIESAEVPAGDSFRMIGKLFTAAIVVVGIHIIWRLL